MAWAGFAFGLAMLLFATSPNVSLAYPLALLVGFSSVWFMTASTAMMQLRSDPRMRGRVLALQAIVLIGSTPVETLLLATKPFVTFLSAGLPALGAAVAGIRVHGDFEASIRRSARTLDQLAELTDDYASAANDDADLDDTADLLIATARVFSEDIAAWQDLYGRKRLTLPA